jgi:hypothetical protein
VGKLKRMQEDQDRHRGKYKRRSMRNSNDNVEPLSRTEERELKRRLDDVRDRTRYILISNLLPGYTMFYNVSEDTFTLNDPQYATIFKRRPTPRMIKDILGERGEAVKCRVDTHGYLIPHSLPKTITKHYKHRRLTTRSTGRDASVTRLAAGRNSRQAARRPLRR